MDRDCLNKHILKLQCEYGDLVNKISARMEYGISDVKCNNKIMILRTMMKKLYCYNPFETEVTQAFTINIVKNDVNSVMDISLEISGETVTYSGAGSQANIYDSLQSDLEVIGFVVLQYNNIMYVYTYSDDYSYTEEPVLTFTSTSVSDDIVITSLEGNECEILDIMNCLNSEALCKIIGYLHSQLKDCGC